MDPLPFDTVAPVVLTLVSLIIELPTGKIPNWVSLTGVLVGIVGGFVAGDPGKHFLGMGVLAVIGIITWMQGPLAGGTMKLLIAIGTLGGLDVGLVAYACVMTIPIFYLIFPPDAPRPSDPPRRRIPSTPFLLAGTLLWGTIRSIFTAVA